jgi:hypothetical protein
MAVLVATELIVAVLVVALEDTQEMVEKALKVNLHLTELLVAVAVAVAVERKVLADLVALEAVV